MNSPETSAPKLYEAGMRSDGKFYFVMQYLEGRTLFDIVHDPSDNLNIEENLLIAMGIAKDLDAYHKKGFVHRDIKAANIMLTDKDVHLCDYGLAKKKEESRTYERKSVLVGTPSCMAPELFDGAVESASTDIFSYGMVLYELFTGNNPIRDEYFDALKKSGQSKESNSPMAGFWQKTVYSKVKYPQAAAEGIPDAVAEVIEKCLEKDPSKRYASGGEVLADLRKAYESLPQETLKSYTQPTVNYA